MKNYVTFLVDSSLSMRWMTAKVTSVFQDLINETKTMAKDSGQQTVAQVRMFDSNLKPGNGFTAVESLVMPVYDPTGPSTALWKATLDLTQELVNLPRKPFENAAHLVIVLTDGADNASSWDDASYLALVLAQQPSLTVAWNVPSKNTAREIERLKLGSAENIKVWNVSEQGLEDVKVATSTGLSTYALARSTGATRVDTFYAQPNLRNITVSDLKDCPKFTSILIPRKVEKEGRIDEFVQKQFGRPYIKGAAFYQLTKPEDIQAHKDVFLREKGKKVVYGGQKVKDLLGIPAYKSGRIKPGDHGDFEIFIQSTSDNRKLVRGTTVLVAK